jgi:hypothetical protein
MQIGVNVLKEQRGAVAGTLGKRVMVMLAADAWLAVCRCWGVALDN